VDNVKGEKPVKKTDDSLLDKDRRLTCMGHETSTPNASCSFAASSSFAAFFDFQKAVAGAHDSVMSSRAAIAFLEIIIVMVIAVLGSLPLLLCGRVTDVGGVVVVRDP